MVPADAPCALRCRFVRMGLRLWRCIAPMGQTDGWRTMWMRNTMGDGGRWARQPPMDGCIIVAPGWLAYLGLVAEIQ